MRICSTESPVLRRLRAPLFPAKLMDNLNYILFVANPDSVGCGAAKVNDRLPAPFLVIASKG
jgi:hypothetical protein